MKYGIYQTEGKGKKRKSSLLWILLLIVGVLAVALIVAFALRRGRTNQDLPPKNEGTVATTAATEAGEKSLTTPVGTLTIPRGLADAVELADTSKGGQYAVSFYGTVGADRVLLFELSVGADGSGYTLGSVPDANGNRKTVSLNISEIEKKPNWSEDAYAQINELQSYVNDLIEQINQLDGFQDGES